MPLLLIYTANLLERKQAANKGFDMEKLVVATDPEHELPAGWQQAILLTE